MKRRPVGEPYAIARPDSQVGHNRPKYLPCSASPPETVLIGQEGCSVVPPALTLREFSWLTVRWSLDLFTVVRIDAWPLARATAVTEPIARLPSKPTLVSEFSCVLSTARSDARSRLGRSAKREPLSTLHRSATSLTVPSFIAIRKLMCFQVPVPSRISVLPQEGI
jgi:hypothetical protein